MRPWRPSATDRSSSPPDQGLQPVRRAASRNAPWARTGPAFREAAEEGSAIIEGMAGLAVAFVLLTLIVQVAGAAVARNAAQAAVSAGARRAARPGALEVEEEKRLAADLATAFPGATGVQVNIALRPRTALATAHFRWLPPGPDWLRLTIVVQAVAPRVVPP